MDDLLIGIVLTIICFAIFIVMALVIGGKKKPKKFDFTVTVPEDLGMGASEYKVMRDWAANVKVNENDMLRKTLDDLVKDLDNALANERYEQAAKIRDDIAAIKEQLNGS